MEFSAEQIDNLLKKQQIAHKFLAGFYQDILARIDKTAKNNKTEFWYWHPCECRRPGRTFPGNNWIWDYLPLYAAGFVFARTSKSNKCETGDFVLAFRVYCDMGFYGKGNISPYAIHSDPSDHGVVDVFIYKVISPTSESLQSVFTSIKPWEKTSETVQKTKENNMLGFSKQFKLNEFIAAPENIQLFIENCLREE
jgi:hypothetical protein